MAVLATEATNETLIRLALEAIGRIRGNEEFEPYVEVQLDFMESWLEELQSRFEVIAHAAPGN